MIVLTPDAMYKVRRDRNQQPIANTNPQWNIPHLRSSEPLLTPNQLTAWCLVCCCTHTTAGRNRHDPSPRDRRWIKAHRHGVKRIKALDPSEFSALFTLLQPRGYSGGRRPETILVDDCLVEVKSSTASAKFWDRLLDNALRSQT